MKHLFIAAILITVAGCNTISDFFRDHPEAAQVAIETGTFAYLNGDDVKAREFIEILERNRDRIEQDTSATISELGDRIRDAIGYSDLVPAQQVAVDGALRVIRTRFNEQIQEGVLSEDDKVTIIEGIDWAIGAAQKVIKNPQ